MLRNKNSIGCDDDILSRTIALVMAALSLHGHLAIIRSGFNITRLALTQICRCPPVYGPLSLDVIDDEGTQSGKNGAQKD